MTAHASPAALIAQRFRDLKLKPRSTRQEDSTSPPVSAGHGSPQLTPLFQLDAHLLSVVPFHSKLLHGSPERCSSKFIEREDRVVGTSDSQPVGEECW